MSAQIYQFRDYQNPKDIERLYQMQSLEQLAVETWFAAVNPFGIAPTNSQPVTEPKDSA